MQHFLQLLESVLNEPRTRCLLIGGFAVNSLGYQRATFDVDFLIPKSDLTAWIALLGSLNYKIKTQQKNFAQFTAPPGWMDVDLMLVSETTFEGMRSAAQSVQFQDQSVQVPSLDHLIALKLHVIRQGLKHRSIKDLDDVIRLVLVNRLDIASSHYQNLFEKYGTLEIYKQVLKAVT